MRPSRAEHTTRTRPNHQHTPFLRTLSSVLDTNRRFNLAPRRFTGNGIESGQRREGETSIYQHQHLSESTDFFLTVSLREVQLLQHLGLLGNRLVYFLTGARQRLFHREALYLVRPLRAQEGTHNRACKTPPYCVEESFYDQLMNHYTATQLDRRKKARGAWDTLMGGGGGEAAMAEMAWANYHQR